MKAPHAASLAPKAALAVVSALLVTWFVWHDSDRISPGPLSAAHAQDPRLERTEGCDRCHGARGESFAQGCASCHAEVAAQIAEGRGFHGGLQHAEAACGACHSEHHGAEFALVGEASFRLAGIESRDRYDHAGLGFALAGRHLELACSACHPQADAVALPAGERRFLGLSQACASCHDDPHAGSLPDCAACHGQEEPFERVARFRHTERFALAGSHAAVACSACHAEDGAHSIEASAVAARSDAARVRACGDCHASPHTEAFVAAAVRLESSVSAAALEPARACGVCHAVTHQGFRAPEARLEPAQHAASGFALEAAHARVACERCHEPPSETAGDPSAAFASFRSAHPGRAAQDCAACHADPHAGQFREGRFGAGGCAACHTTEAFEPPRFDLAMHEQSRFPLAGSHAAVACGQCHAEETLSGGAHGRRFTGTPRACAGCHQDVHQGFFAARGQDCDACHASTAFTEVASRFDHAAATGFALAGSHARAACESCHGSGTDAGRRLGSVAAHVAGNPRECASCHADAHAGFFAARAASGALADARCSSCHTEERFSPVIAGFDHGAATGHALRGAHARAACTACHARLEQPTAAGRTFAAAPVEGSVANASCSACHADPHRGAFDRAGLLTEVAGRTGCARCHGEDRFDALFPEALVPQGQVQGGRGPEASFDHASWTGFELAGVHARIACADCHARGAASADGAAAPFGRARGRDCASCHADPHAGQFALAGRTDCARCHAADQERFDADAFDHGRDSRFALDATHARLACSACHRPEPLSVGGSAVRYKPLGTVCGDCHDPRARSSSPPSFGKDP